MSLSATPQSKIQDLQSKRIELEHLYTESLREQSRRSTLLELIRKTEAEVERVNLEVGHATKMLERENETNSVLEIALRNSRWEESSLGTSLRQKEVLFKTTKATKQMEAEKRAKTSDHFKNQLEKGRVQIWANIESFTEIERLMTKKTEMNSHLKTLRQRLTGEEKSALRAKVSQLQETQESLESEIQKEKSTLEELKNELIRERRDEEVQAGSMIQNEGVANEDNQGFCKKDSGNDYQQDSGVGLFCNTSKDDDAQGNEVPAQEESNGEEAIEPTVNQEESSPDGISSDSQFSHSTPLTNRTLLLHPNTLTGANTLTPIEKSSLHTRTVQITPSNETALNPLVARNAGPKRFLKGSGTGHSSAKRIKNKIPVPEELMVPLMNKLSKIPSPVKPKTPEKTFHYLQKDSGPGSFGFPKLDGMDSPYESVEKSQSGLQLGLQSKEDVITGNGSSSNVSSLRATEPSHKQTTTTPIEKPVLGSFIGPNQRGDSGIVIMNDSTIVKQTQQKKSNFVEFLGVADAKTREAKPSETFESFAMGGSDAFSFGGPDPFDATGFGDIEF